MQAETETSSKLEFSMWNNPKLDLNWHTYHPSISSVNLQLITILLLEFQCNLAGLLLTQMSPIKPATYSFPQKKKVPIDVQYHHVKTISSAFRWNLVLCSNHHTRYISVNSPGKLTEGILVMVYQVFPMELTPWVIPCCIVRILEECS